MVDADERVKERERPEPDQRQLVTVDGVPDARGQEVVDQHVAGRRDPEPDDVVDEQAVPGRVVDTRDVVRAQDEEDEVHVRPDEGRDEIPQGDVERRLPAVLDRHQELHGQGQDRQEDDDDVDQGELPGLPAPVEAGGEEDDGHGQVQVPDPEQPMAPALVPQSHAAEARHDVVAEANEERGERAPDHAVDVDRAEPAEGEPGLVAEEFRVRELSGQDDAQRREEEEPEEAPGEPAPDQRPIDDVVVQALRLGDPRLPNVSGAGHARSPMKASRPRQSPRYHEKRIGCTASNRCPRLFARTTLNGSSPGARSLNAIQGLSLSAEVNVKRLIGQDPETRTPCPQISPVLLSYDLLRTTYGRPTYSLGGRL